MKAARPRCGAGVEQPFDGRRGTFPAVTAPPRLSPNTNDSPRSHGMKAADAPIGPRDFVMLDPAVELLAYDHEGSRLLCHHELEMGLSLPAGEGLVELVTSLMCDGAKAAALRAAFDDAELVDELLSSLRRHGFLLVASQPSPDADRLERLRLQARRLRGDASRPVLEADLDEKASLEHIEAFVRNLREPADLQLRCARLADHTVAFERLAELRRQGRLRVHGTMVRTLGLECSPVARRALLRLGGSVFVEGDAWPPPNRDIPGLDQLIRGLIPVHALMSPGAALFRDDERAGAGAWAASVCLSGLQLLADPEELWPDGDAGDDEFIQLFESVHALCQECGDVRFANLPSDEILVGTAAPRKLSSARSPFAERFRKAYLRWQLSLIKASESDNTWSQVPEAEAKFVRPEDDLLPNHPELLKLEAGSVLLDVCGGMGRVARRLAPAVGLTGLVISVEAVPCLVDRARRFAAEMSFDNVQFRVGVAQRIPLPDASVDAAVNEWTGAIWELGHGPAMIREMVRVVRPGGRIAVTHRLVQLPLTRLGEPWVQYDEIYAWVKGAFDQQGLRLLSERVWGQIVPRLAGENASSWREQHVTPILDPFDFHYDSDRDPTPRADVYLTLVAERTDRDRLEE